MRQKVGALIANVGLVSLAILPGALFAQASAPNMGNHEISADTAVFAAGCYWGVESVFEHVRGVSDVISGFAVPAAPAGSAPPTSHTGYAEAVLVVYDRSRITYEQLLQVFFLVAHDPTEVDRQGPDIGPQYRSVIFADAEDRRRAARTMLDDLSARRVFIRPITTEIVSIRSFRPAPDQDYVVHNPGSPYVVQNDLPKLAELRRRYPALYRQ